MITTTLTWLEVRTDATLRFGGQLPRPEDETTIAQHFAKHPLLTIYAIRDVADEVTAGKARWGWSTLATRLKRPVANITIDVHVTPPSTHECPDCHLKFASAHRLTEHQENIHLELERTPPPTSLLTSNQP